ncbi:DUF7109 family protein [Halomarina rubra]|uniref:Uncharacterized protein n=1 Tax=Halomarina rubra TaxID=2071873 RepID=A0ABD6AUR2_9EURY|nr:hypothetical protein [Halomarina rubra]
MSDDATDAEPPEPFSPNADAVAGVVDLFGALTPAELRKALAELAFKRGVDAPPDAVVEAAVDSYHLLDHDGLLVVGPAAFPTLPEGAADLPHILDVERESPQPHVLATTAERRFREEAERALAAATGGDADEGANETDEGQPDLDWLVDVSYDLEAWGPVDVGDLRRRLVAARDDEDGGVDGPESRDPR